MDFKQYNSNLSFLDLLFNTLLAFVAFFALSMILIAPKTKDSKNVEAKADAMITLTWDKDVNDDVDLYVEDPMGQICFFQCKQIGFLSLDRDDLGHLNDKYVVGGQVFEYKENREVMTIRGLMQGEYTVNVHMYRKGPLGDTPMSVVLEKLNPSVRVFAHKDLVLSEHGEEKTAFRFVVNEKGEITEILDLPKSFVDRRHSQFAPTQSADELQGENDE